MPTSPPSITAIPDFPSISDRVTYNAKAYAWATALDNVTAGEISAVATNVYNNSVGAANTFKRLFHSNKEEMVERMSDIIYADTNRGQKGW